MARDILNSCGRLCYSAGLTSGHLELPWSEEQDRSDAPLPLRSFGPGVHEQRAAHLFFPWITCDVDAQLISLMAQCFVKKQRGF